MQELTIQAKSVESGLALLEALAPFAPLMKMEEGKCFIAVQIGADSHVLQVTDAIHDHFAARLGNDPVRTAFRAHKTARAERQARTRLTASTERSGATRRRKKIAPAQ
jgi:hypothetical protein